VEVLGPFVSSPHATRKCRWLPEAQERGLTFVIRMHRLERLQPISICKTHGARGRGAIIVRRRRRAATAALSADVDMVRRVGSSSWRRRVDMGMEAVCLFCYRSVIAVTIHM